MSSSTSSPTPAAAPATTRARGGGRNPQPKLIIAVTEADSPLGHAIACRLLATNQWAKILAIIRPLPSPDSTPTPSPIRGNPLAAHLHSLGATLVPSTSRPHLLRAFQAARALVLVPPASTDMPNQVARILEFAKLAGSPAMHLGPATKETRGVRGIVFVSDVAAQFPAVEVKIGGDESSALDSAGAESNNNKAKVINMAKVYKDTEEIVLGACKRATSIVRAGIIMQDLLPLIEPGAQSNSIRFNADMDAKFAPVNASDLALGIHVLAHCLASGRTHPAFAAPPPAAAAAATQPPAAGKGKGKAPTSHAGSAKPTTTPTAARAPHGRIYLFTSQTFESLASIHAHLRHVLTPYISSSSLKPGTADLIHVSANVSDTTLHAYLTAKHLAHRPAGVRAFHTDRIVYHGALVRLGKLATARSAELERLIMRPPTRLAQVIADHGKRFVPAAAAVEKVSIRSEEDGMGERLEVGIAVAGTEE